MTKFNYTRGKKTKERPLPVVRLITKEHSIYPIYFNKYGVKRSKEEVEKLLKQIKESKDEPAG